MKKDYKNFVKLAKKLINEWGTDITVVCGLNSVDDDKPYLPKADKQVEYTTVGVINPPVRGIYFQGTRFGTHTVTEDGKQEDAISCFLLPVYDENGKVIDLSKATHIIGKSVDNDSTIRYKVYFCDTMKPAERVIFFSYGLGR